MSSTDKKKSKKNSADDIKPESKKDKKKDKKSKKEEIYDRNDYIEYIVHGVEHLSYKNRLDILKMVYDSSYKDHITESSDGSRIDAEKLPDDLLIEIKKFVQTRVEAIDITTTF